MVTGRPSGLPDFAKPPVVETVLSVQFEPLDQMRAAHFGLFWGQLKDRYPKTAEHPALDSVFERFAEPPRRRLGVQVQAYETPPLPRFWFTNADQTELMQVQTDRFIKNWRKVGDATSYPRYEPIRKWFESDFGCFQRFVEKEVLESVHVNQCEVTYVNHIVAGEGWSTHVDVEKVFTVWRQPGGTIPGRAEDLIFQARFPIEDHPGHPVGRLHVEMQPAVRNADGKPMFVFNLTARGFLGRDVEFFDLGREWIVRAFTEMTTPTMHEIWERRQ